MNLMLENNMNDKIAQLLTELAIKFGTTVEHLWGVLVKQAYINACNQIIYTIIIAVAWFAIYKFVEKKTTIPKDSHYADWSGDGKFFGWLLVTAVSICLMVQLCYTVGICLTAFNNPEYWALKQIIS